MKKFLFALLVGVMVAGTASIAAAEVTVGGSIEMRYPIWHDLQLNHFATLGTDGNTQETNNFWATRVLLSVDAKVAEGLEGYIELDTENTEDWWGGRTAGLSEPLDSDGRAYLNHHDASVRIQQAWINFMIPGAPAGIKIGHQPLALGHGIFLDTHRMGSDAILAFAKPIPELLVAGVWITGLDNLSYIPTSPGGSHKDVNFYAVLANYTWMENNTAGMHFTYATDNNTSSNTDTVNPNDRRHIYATNTALVVDGTVAGVTYKGEVDWQYIGVPDAGGSIGDDYTSNAWAAMLGASYKVDMATLGMEVAYGTGNNSNDANHVGDTTNGLSNDTGLDNNDHAYATPYNATSYNYAYLYNDKIGQGIMGGGGGMGLGDGTGGFGLANTGFAKLSAGISPTDRLTVGLDVLYLRASATMIPQQSRDLGWEVDANLGYKIYDNLKLDLMGGLFLPGAYYAFQGRTESGVSNAQQLTDPTNSLSPIKRDIAWGMETKLTMNF